jgi:hypothetical protein
MINGCTVSWVSKKQSTVSLSSAEAEHMAVSAAVQEIKWIKQLLQEITMKPDKSTTLLCDNQSAIQISNNDMHHNRTKHIDIRHHFIRDALKNKEFNMVWIPTEEQVADILTKSLAVIQFTRLRDLLMNGYQGTQGHK